MPAGLAGLKPGDIVKGINGSMLPARPVLQYANDLIQQDYTVVKLLVVPGDGACRAAIWGPAVSKTSDTGPDGHTNGPSSFETNRSTSRLASGAASPVCILRKLFEPTKTAPVQLNHVRPKPRATCRGCSKHVLKDEAHISVPPLSAVYHTKCFHCDACGSDLQGTSGFQLTPAQKLSCRDCWVKREAKQCANCFEPIVPTGGGTSRVVSTAGLSFHVLCFVCFNCDEPLSGNTPFRVKDGRVYCKGHDCQHEMQALQETANA